MTEEGEMQLIEGTEISQVIEEDMKEIDLHKEIWDYRGIEDNEVHLEMLTEDEKNKNQEIAPIAVTVVQVVMALAPPVMRIRRRKIMNRLHQARMSLKMKAK